MDLLEVSKSIISEVVFASTTYFSSFLVVLPAGECPLVVGDYLLLAGNHP
jgi:hypothetical protein